VVAVGLDNFKAQLSRSTSTFLAADSFILFFNPHCKYAVGTFYAAQNINILQWIQHLDGKKKLLVVVHKKLAVLRNLIRSYTDG
jgi:hypothetical protein